MNLSIDHQFRSPNFSARTQLPGKPLIFALVIHDGEGTVASDLDALTDDRRPMAERVSAHYYCAPDAIHQLVDDTMEAWHAGVSDNVYLGYKYWNLFSIGIESFHKRGTAWDTRVWDNITDLAAAKIAQYKIPRPFVVMHRTIAPVRKQDPTNISDTSFANWADRLYVTPAPDYAQQWGSYAAYNPTYGIPQTWRKQQASGTPLGEALTDETELATGGVAQVFEHGTVIWHPDGTTIVER